MGRTILCPHCKSALNEDILKQRNSENICLVCGKPLWADKEDPNEISAYDKVEKIDLENPDMYFYDIDDEEDEENEELRDVWCQCTTCKEVNAIPCNHFDIFKKKYVKLKDDVEIHCKGCGKAVTNPAIPKRPDGWRKRDMWVKDYENIPKCPICSSTKIHRISLTNKAASALAFGVLSAGHVSKTYKCDTCGAKF